MFIIENITNGTVSHLLIHVDDIDIFADDEHDVEFILKKMDKEWGITTGLLLDNMDLVITNFTLLLHFCQFGTSLVVCTQTFESWTMKFW